MKHTLPYTIARPSMGKQIMRPFRFIWLKFTTNYHWRVAWRRAGE